MIYLDYNATAPMRQVAFSAACELLQKPLNPSSIHAQGRFAKAILEKSRAKIAELIGCFSNELLFVASGSEANNMVLKGASYASLGICSTEHSSVKQVVKDYVKLPVDFNGLLDLKFLQEFLQNTQAPALICVMLANNETGVIQPINQIAEIIHYYQGLLHVDAVQAFGKVIVDCNLLQADFLSLSGHKVGGGLGAGALFISAKQRLKPLIQGGGQESNLRAGTENLAAISAFAAAALHAVDNLAQYDQLRGWLNELEGLAKARFPNEAIVIGEGACRLPNTSLLRQPNMASETQLIHFDMNGIAVSAGSACSSGRITRSHVVEAMLGESYGADVIRLSGGWDTTYEDIMAFQKLWLKLSDKVKAT
jgi:cysteine desulfurase